MEAHIKAVYTQFAHDLHEAASAADCERLRVQYLGKKGPIPDLMKALKEVSSEEKPLVGKSINDLKNDIEIKITRAESACMAKEEEARLGQEALDVTLPGRRRWTGHKHPLIETLDEVIDILSGMGFTVQYGPDIDTDYYNFEALNFPPDHPARDMQDTFYITDKILLRTHTSNVQVRIMENNKPPIRIIAPGISYRNEAVSARSHVFFHQVEALYIDKGVSFANLFGTFDEFLEKFFHRTVATRYRPSFFPFVEPGLECDISCLSCQGTGCPLCKFTGWLEIGGAGMVHPEVLKNGGIDPEEYSGYAWGIGPGRLCMLKYGIKDIRLFTENDLRFLNQFTACL